MKPRTSGDYSENLTAASFSALLELSLTLNRYRNSIVLVGGWAPYLLIEQFGRGDFKHVGSIDIDIAVNPENIDPDTYATIVEMIEDRGYVNRKDNAGIPIKYSFTKSIQSRKLPAPKGLAFATRAGSLLSTNPFVSHGSFHMGHHGGRRQW